MLPRIADLTPHHLEALIGATEGVSLDFKRELPLKNREERREFLADVVAMANSEGGDILIGVTEEQENGERIGIATDVPGVECNPDATLLSLENIIRDGVAPRLSGLQSAAVPVGDGRYVLVIRIRKSWSGPHMVNLGDSRFYARNSRGKFALDVTQIRAAFNGADYQRERIRLFRDERIGKVLSGNTPVPLRDTAVGLLHVIPIGHREYGTTDVRDFQKHSDALAAPTQLSAVIRYNIDGLLIAPTSDRPARNYVQCFRDGVVEFADAFYLPMRQPGYEKSVNTQDFERIVIAQTQATTKILDALGFTGPFVVMLSIIGVKDRMLDWWDELNERHFSFDRDVVALPDILLEDATSDHAADLKQVFDAFWQSAGYSHSRSYLGERWRGWRG